MSFWNKLTAKLCNSSNSTKCNSTKTKTAQGKLKRSLSKKRRQELKKFN